MDRARSAQLQTQLSPWLSNFQQPQPEPQSLARIPIKLTPATHIPHQSEQMKLFHKAKFNKVMEQHRQRLLRKKVETVVKSVDVGEEAGKETGKESMGRARCSQGEIGIEGNGEEKAMGRKSSTMTKLGDVVQTEMKSFKPNISNNSQQQKQIIRAFYRPKPGNRNADKFYGSLNRKLQPQRPKFSSTILLTKKDQPVMALPHRRIESMNSLSNPPPPLKSVLKMKLVNYRSLKSIQKLKFMASAGKKEAGSRMKEEAHVLDRILVSR